MAATTPLTAAPAALAMNRFIETEDLSLLEKPLLFETNQTQFRKLLCCQGGLALVASSCLAVACVPIGVCCPYSYADQYSLRLDKDSVQVSTANNDCCCHIAKTIKTVPLEKIQDVELQSNCLLTCFGLKAVNIQTAGQGGTVLPEVSAVFLAQPEKVREAVQLAVKLYRQPGRAAGGAGGGGAAPRSAWGDGAQAAAAARLAGAPGSLLGRLRALDGLVARGVLSRAEADGLKVTVLAAAEETWLERLGEAADLRDRGLISADEFAALKASLLGQLKAAAA